MDISFIDFSNALGKFYGLLIGILVCLVVNDIILFIWEIAKKSIHNKDGE